MIRISVLFSLLLIGCASDRSGISKPGLSPFEETYFQEIAETYHCTPDRSVNEHILEGDKDREFAHYSLILRDFPDSLYQKGDEYMLNLGRQIARTLHHDVLLSNYPFAYDNITIGFDSNGYDQLEFQYDYRN